MLVTGMYSALLVKGKLFQFNELVILVVSSIVVSFS